MKTTDNCHPELVSGSPRCHSGLDPESKDKCSTPLVLAASFAAALAAAGAAENQAQAQGAELPENIVAADLPGEQIHFRDLYGGQTMRDPFSQDKFTVIAQGTFSPDGIAADGGFRSADFTATDNEETNGINLRASGPFMPIEELAGDPRRYYDAYFRLSRGDGTPGARVWANTDIIEVNGERRLEFEELEDCDGVAISSVHPSPLPDHLRFTRLQSLQPYLFDVPIDAPNYCTLIVNTPVQYHVDELSMAGFDTKSAPCTPDGNVCVGIYQNPNTREESARLKGRNPQGTLVHLGCAANAQTGLLECSPEPRPGRTGRPDPAFNRAQAFTTVRTPNGRNIDLFFALPRVISLDRVNGDASNLREVPVSITLSPNPAPLDSDNDGTPDMDDRCPGRAAGEDVKVSDLTGAEPLPEPYEPRAECAADCGANFPGTSEPAPGQVVEESGLRNCESPAGIRDLLGMPHALVNEDGNFTLYANRPDIAVTPDTTEISPQPGDRFVFVDTISPFTPEAVRNLDRTIRIPPNFPVRLQIFSTTRPDGTPGRIVFRHEPVTADDILDREVAWEGPTGAIIDLPAGGGGGAELGVEGCVVLFEVLNEPVNPTCPPVCGEPDAGQPPQPDAGQPPPDTGPQPPQDAGEPDAGAPPQSDAGPAQDAGADADSASVIPDTGPESPDVRDAGDASPDCSDATDAGQVIVPPVDAGCGQECPPADAGPTPPPDAGTPPPPDAGPPDAGQSPQPDAGRPDTGTPSRPDAGTADTTPVIPDADATVPIQPDAEPSSDSALADAADAQPQPDTVPVIPDTDAVLVQPDAGNVDARDQGLPGQTPDAGKIASPDARNDNVPAAGNDTDTSGCSCEIASLNNTEAPNNPLFLLASAIAAAYAGTRRRILNAFRKQ